MSAARHDKTVAATSHLPHLVASALAAATPEEYLPMAARGWRDTTRVAAGDPDMWRQIFMANRTHVLAALRRYERTLAGLRLAMEREDGAKLERILTEAKQNRDALGS
jgi:prephenate dehydrogenase